MSAASHKAYIERLLLVYEAAAVSGWSDDPEPHSLSQMQVAVLCASHGLPVAPAHGLANDACTCGRKCGHPGRHPRIDLKDATTDVKLIHELWKRWPKAKVIIATGEPDVIAVRATGRKGERTLNSLIDQHSESSENNESSSEPIKFRGRRTVTYLLRAPADGLPTGRVRLAEGVVVHGRGSFVVVPRNVKRPSRAKHLYLNEISPAPNWLLKLLGLQAGSTTPSELPAVEKEGVDIVYL